MLRSISLIKKKRCGKMKGRTVADRRKQKLWIPKEEEASPTVNLETLTMSLIVDVFEGRDIAIVDIGGALRRRLRCDQGAARSRRRAMQDQPRLHKICGERIRNQDIVHAA